jgi:hypothetical protein
MPDLTVISTLAAAVAAIAAAISATLSYRANLLGQQVAREQIAAQAIAQYIDLNLRYPQFSTSQKWERYSNYVFGVLTMARTVLAAYPSDKNWRGLVREHLAYHRSELALWKEDIDVFGSEVAELVSEVLSDDANSAKAAG